jgi:glutamyl-Q tRNA(Asp) synthetase
VIGRFAPSPTGPLHAGSLVAALGSWLDARARGGSWLIRIEDVDRPRCPPGTDTLVLGQLAACGLQADEAPVWQSRRDALYEDALRQLLRAGLAYACRCSRSAIQAAIAAQGRPPRPFGGELVYPGSCRPDRPLPLEETAIDALLGQAGTAIRLRLPEASTAATADWLDHRLGQAPVERHQDVAAEVGDFVLRRADGLFAYQLAVVVDDAAQGVSHVVRGADLADNTPRQILLQRLLGLPAELHYLHLPLVLAADGHKLSKQNGATALDLADPLAALGQAAAVLGLPAAPVAAPLTDTLAFWERAWPDRLVTTARAAAIPHLHTPSSP